MAYTPYACSRIRLVNSDNSKPVARPGRKALGPPRRRIARLPKGRNASSDGVGSYFYSSTLLVGNLIMLCRLLWGRCLRALPLSGVLLGVLLGAAPSSDAAEPAVYRIEEDWEMVLTEPQPSTHSPQLTFFTLPVHNNLNQYFQLQLNHAADDYFSGGGYQVAAVRSGTPVDYNRSGTYAALSTDAQSVRWTNVMAVINGELCFAVKDGYGDDWGAFGGPDYLVRMPAGTLENLAGYDPQKSLDMADIGFGGNRVASLVLKRVRLYYDNGQIVDTEINSSP